MRNPLIIISNKTPPLKNIYIYIFILKLVSFSLFSETRYKSMLLEILFFFFFFGAVVQHINRLFSYFGLLNRERVSSPLFRLFNGHHHISPTAVEEGAKERGAIAII